MYGLKQAYMNRAKPDYFEDTLPDSIHWQADVYRLAGALAYKTGVKRLVDIGCGRGLKLKQFAGEFQIIGIDYGKNIEALQRNDAIGKWIITDLNSQIIPSHIFEHSVVICADVIEHLPSPAALLETLRNAAEVAPYVIVSTPDRARVYGFDQDGPPDNMSHVREWTHLELIHWFQSEGLPIIWHGWTVSNDTRRELLNTSLVILSKTETIRELPIYAERG